MVVNWLKPEPKSNPDISLVPRLVYIFWGSSLLYPVTRPRGVQTNTPPCQSIVQGSNLDHFNMNKRGPKGRYSPYIMKARYIEKISPRYIEKSLPFI